MLQANAVAANESKVVRTEIIGSPREEQGEVTLRVKVTGNEDRPITALNKNDFQVKITDTKQGTTRTAPGDLNFVWQSPDTITPPPAYILVLFDFSGSMQCSTNLSSQKSCSEVPTGERKIDAAVKALENFLANIPLKAQATTHISLVPFGEEGKCSSIYKLINKANKGTNKKTIDDFLRSDDGKLGINLKNISSQIPCASTNIYYALTEGVNFLTNQKDTSFYPVDEKGNPKPEQPRLSIILFTDGLDTDPFIPEEKKARQSQDRQIKKLRKLLERNPQIMIHTLGYGLTPEQLGEKYKLGRSATWGDIDKPVPKAEYLDVQGLENIGKLTTGLSTVSADGEEIAEQLGEFLKSILGEYEIKYEDPASERDNPYKVQVIAQGVSSKPAPYKAAGFGMKVPFPFYFVSWGLFLLFALLWLIPYEVWRRRLKQEK